MNYCFGAYIPSKKKKVEPQQKKEIEILDVNPDNVKVPDKISVFQIELFLWLLFYRIILPFRFIRICMYIYPLYCFIMTFIQNDIDGVIRIVKSNFKWRRDWFFIIINIILLISIIRALL